MNVKTRFAPSPTGMMHVGGVRTALFAWLWARKNNGQFALRIEDTDRNRLVEGSEQHIFDCLDWLGLDIDDGSSQAPIRQSERLELYRQYAQGLINQGLAYADPFTPEQVNEFRQQAQAEKRPFLFRNHRPDNPQTPDDWYGQVSLRFKVPELKRYNWHDEVRGDLSAGEDALDDFIIVKSDGYPTYNFAHIIDDHDMNITHVIRGEEFIASMPKFLSLIEALGFERPVFATAPPILGKEGGKKLSKRDGAKDLLEYKADGYLPEALLNFLASLGWNDGSQKEVYSRQELIDAFELSRIQKSGARFDEAKLDWLNWQVFAGDAQANFRAAAPQDMVETIDASPIALADVVPLAVDKANSVQSFIDQVQIFYDANTFALTTENLANVDKDLSLDTAKAYLQAALERLQTTEPFTAESIETNLRQLLDELQAAPRQLLNLIRWSISNSKVSPNLFETIATLGKDQTLSRIQASLNSAQA